MLSMPNTMETGRYFCFYMNRYTSQQPSIPESSFVWGKPGSPNTCVLDTSQSHANVLAWVPDVTAWGKYSNFYGMKTTGVSCSKGAKINKWRHSHCVPAAGFDSVEVAVGYIQDFHRKPLELVFVFVFLTLFGVWKTCAGGRTGVPLLFWKRRWMVWLRAVFLSLAYW